MRFPQRGAYRFFNANKQFTCEVWKKESIPAQTGADSKDRCVWSCCNTVTSLVLDFHLFINNPMEKNYSFLLFASIVYTLVSCSCSSSGNHTETSAYNEPL